MEENKKCCEGENKNECCFSKMCCDMKKCHIMKFFVMVIIMIIIFCLGIQLGEFKSEIRNGHRYQGKMMNWNYKMVKPVDIEEKIPVNSTEETSTPTLKQ